MEWTLLDSGSGAQPGAAIHARFRILRRWLLAAPSGTLILWLLTKLPAVFSGKTYSRPWTVGQRLLTEPRVLCDYLQQLWIPRASGASLFNDGYLASTSLVHPWQTLPAIAAIAALLALGFRLRRKHPILAFAILFYFAGQLLESTLIPLELYFEHRNYLPALPMFWPLAVWLTGPGALRLLRHALAFMLPVILALLCHARAGIWGQPFEQALLLAQLEPASPRAQANAATYEIAHGAVGAAVTRLKAAAVKMPDEVQLTLNWIDAECALGKLTPAAKDAALYSVKHNGTNTEFVQNWLTGAIETATQHRCEGLDLQWLEAMTQAENDNQNYGDGPEQLVQVRRLQGRIALARGDGKAALRDFDEGLSAFTTPDGALLQAALLGSAGFPDLGLRHLEYYRTLTPADRESHGMAGVHFWLLEREGYWSSEFTGLESQLRIDANAAAMPGAAQAPASGS
jgi:protein O-mannosyl-transferase